MLSVLIETMDDEEGLARTLASLVGAAVEGVVRDVVVCDRGSSDHTAHVADHAGCIWLEASEIAAGIRRAKCEWLVMLEPGSRLAGGWTEPVLGHVSRAATPARFSRSRAEPAPFLSRFFSAQRPLADGLLISRRQAGALARPGIDAASLASAVRPKRLPAEIFVAPVRR